MLYLLDKTSIGPTLLKIFLMLNVTYKHQFAQNKVYSGKVSLNLSAGIPYFCPGNFQCTVISVVSIDTCSVGPFFRNILDPSLLLVGQSQ